MSNHIVHFTGNELIDDDAAVSDNHLSRQSEANIDTVACGPLAPGCINGMYNFSFLSAELG